MHFLKSIFGGKFEMAEGGQFTRNLQRRAFYKKKYQTDDTLWGRNIVGKRCRNYLQVRETYRIRIIFLFL